MGGRCDLRDEEPGADAGVLPVLRAGAVDRTESSHQREGAQGESGAQLPFSADEMKRILEASDRYPGNVDRMKAFVLTRLWRFRIALSY